MNEKELLDRAFEASVRYQERIDRQKAAIERLQETIVQHEARESQMKEGLDQRSRANARLQKELAFAREHADSHCGLGALFCEYANGKKKP